MKSGFGGGQHGKTQQGSREDNTLRIVHLQKIAYYPGPRLRPGGMGLRSEVFSFYARIAVVVLIFELRYKLYITQIGE